MKLANKLLILFCLMLATISYSCSNESNKINQANDSSSTSLETSETKFKTWLRDTSIVLSEWKTQQDLDVVEKGVEIGEDSLSLTIRVLYNSIIGSTKSSNVEVSNMIDLLNEYEENLENSSKLSFNYEGMYFPSSVEQLPYELSYEISNIQVKNKNSTTKYNFIRGRLSGKEEELNGKIVKTDFIWEGDKLIKKQRQER